MRKNHIRLISLFIWIVVLAALVGLMWVRGWQPGTIIYTAVWESSELFDVGVGRPIEIMMSLLFGIYFATLTLFTIDWRKRVQGVLLFVGSIIVLGVLWISNMLLVHLDLNLVNGLTFAVGVTVIGYLERDELYTLLDNHSWDSLEFDRAITLLFFAVSLVVITAWIQVFLVGDLRFLIDTVATIGLVYVLVGFFSFDSNATTAIVGPRESGKTTTILGLYNEFENRRDNVTEPTTVLDDLQSQIDDLESGDDWPIDNTYGFEEVGFYHVISGLFPRRYRISAYDHPGETLDKLADTLSEELTVRQRIKSFVTSLQELLIPGFSRPKEDRFFNETRNADLAVLLIDMERILNSEKGTEVHKLRQVGHRINENGGEVIVAATKVDLILDEFLATTDMSYNETQNMATAYTIKEPLNEYLQGRNQISDMLTDVGCDEIYPLYYEHSEQNGEAFPVLDEHGNLKREGHSELAKEVEEVLKNV